MRAYQRLLIILIGLVLIIVGLAPTHAQGPDGRAHHAGVVVQYPTGEIVSACVGFDEETISGYDLMARAGFDVVAEGSNGLGALVCSIDGQGCDYPNESCACRCEGGSECDYWAYTHLIDGVWQYSTLGASSYKVRDGAVDGWSWGGGAPGQGSTPPLTSWDAVCAAQAQPLPTAIPPTNTLEPPTAAPPTAAPPTAAPPTAAPPTAAPPTQTPAESQQQAQPTRVPTETPAESQQRAQPTRVPTETPAPSATAATPSQASASQPSARATAVPSSPSPTKRAAAPEPAGSVATVQPTRAARPAAPPAPQQSSGILSYLGFGALLLLLLGASLLMLRRRSRI